MKIITIGLFFFIFLMNLSSSYVSVLTNTRMYFGTKTINNKINNINNIKVDNYKSLNIHIGAGGNTALYLLGVLAYIKKYFDIDNSKYTGVSAGSYISLISICQNDLSDFDKLWHTYINDDKKHNIPIYKFNQIAKTLTKNILKSHNDIDINKINLSVFISKINKNKIVADLYNDYNSLEELLEICECSSYLPYLSGSTYSKKYKNNSYIDGIFTLKNELINDSDLIITKEMWGRIILPHNFLFCNYKNYKKLYELGWEDTKKNHNILLNKLKERKK